MSSSIMEDTHSVMCTLNKCKIYIDRLDYLFAGDISEDTYHERLAKDLQDFETANKICTKF